jgi:hypothetical protein
MCVNLSCYGDASTADTPTGGQTVGCARITKADCLSSANKLDALAKEQPHAAVSHKQNVAFWRQASKIAPEKG